MATREERLEYNRRYYRENKHKWNKRTPEQQEEYNRRRREKYKSDPEYREKVKEQSDSARKKNPWQRRLTQYGLTHYEYELMLNDGCGICGASFELESTKVAIDHDHSTGKVRGLLCQPCNLGIGHFRDDPIALANAVNYLMKGGTYAPMER